MAVTLHLSPPSVAYSRQPIAVSILTDNIAVGQQAYIALIFSAQGCIEGDVLVLKWSGKTCSFLFRALPDTSGNQLPVFTGTDFSYYVAFQLRDALASNGAINDDFVIEKGVPNQISLVHRATTAVTITTIGSVVHNLVFNVFNIASPTLKQNLSAYIRLTDSNGGVLGPPFSVPFDMRDGQAHFDVHSAFSGLAPTLPPAISLNPNAPWWESFALQSVRQYRILFSEKFGAPPALQSLSKSPVFTVVYGTAPTFPTSPSVILHSLAIAKVLSPVQPDYAYLYVSAHFESAYFEISLRFSDGTTYLYLPYNPLIQSIELRPNQVYIFRTGFEQLGLHKLNFPRKKIVAYEWRILNDNTVSNPTGAPTTEIAQINYQLDWGYDGADIFLLCNNGSGGMETIRLRGAIREKYTVEMTEIENIDGSKDSFGEELTTTYEVTTAFMRTDLARHYRLLLTGQLWLCNIKKHVFIRVIRVTKEIEINPNSPFNALKFSFAIAAKEI